jgi:hypothetical protein
MMPGTNYIVVTESLTSKLISRLKAIKQDYSDLPEALGKKRLVHGIMSDISMEYGEVIASNLSNIIDYYFEQGNMDVDDLINFLDANKSLDLQTIAREEKEQFDLKYGTLTSPIISQFELPESISLHRFQTSHRYHPSPIASVTMALKAVVKYGVTYNDYIFMDVGSGMARNLLLASEYPFKKLVGIEHSKYLHDVAVINVFKYQAKTGTSGIYELLCIDALEYAFPPENMLIYVWRPFSNEVASQFFARLEASIQNMDRRVVLVLLGPVYPAVEQSPIFKLLDVYFSPDLTFNEENFTITFYSNK